MPASVKSEVGGAGHHIQDVAHHFLSPATPPARRDHRSSGGFAKLPAPCHFAVASLQPELSNRLVRDLARATQQSLPTAHLAEPPVILRGWAATGQGDPDTVDHPPQCCLGPGGGLQAVVNAGDQTGGSVALPLVDWLDLGEAGREHLGKLEATTSWCRQSGCPVGGRDGLVWCVPLGQAESWWSAYCLGRLAAALQPIQIKILLCEEGAGADQRKGRTGSQPTTAEDSPVVTRRSVFMKKRCQEVHSAGSQPVQPEVLLLPAATRAARRLSALRSVVRGLVQATRNS